MAWPSLMSSWSHMRAVLVRQWHEHSVGDAGGTPGVREEHQCEQALHLRLVRHERREDPREPDRLGAEIGADCGLLARGEVALVEHEVERGEHTRSRLGSSASAGTR